MWLISALRLLSDLYFRNAYCFGLLQKLVHYGYMHAYLMADNIFTEFIEVSHKLLNDPG